MLAPEILNFQSLLSRIIKLLSIISLRVQSAAFLTPAQRIQIGSAPHYLLLPFLDRSSLMDLARQASVHLTTLIASKSVRPTASTMTQGADPEYSHPIIMPETAENLRIFHTACGSGNIVEVNRLAAGDHAPSRDYYLNQGLVSVFLGPLLFNPSVNLILMKVECWQKTASNGLICPNFVL